MSRASEREKKVAKRGRWNETGSLRLEQASTDRERQGRVKTWRNVRDKAEAKSRRLEKRQRLGNVERSKREKDKEDSEAKVLTERLKQLRTLSASGNCE